MRQLKARIGKLRSWLKEEQVSTVLTTLADYIQSIMSRKAQVEIRDKLKPVERRLPVLKKHINPN